MRSSHLTIHGLGHIFFIMIHICSTEGQTEVSYTSVEQYEEGPQTELAGTNLMPLSLVSQAQCLDENTLVFYYRDTQDNYTVNCPHDRPFCNDKLMTCVMNKPDIKFSCPVADGFYPVIDDCTKFIVCQNNMSYTFQCPPKQAYCHTKRKCSRWTRCRKIDCRNNNGKWVPYPKDDRLHSMCYKNVPVSLNECPVTWVFSPRLQKCVINCVGDGLIHDPKDNSRYFSCQGQRKGFQAYVYNCPHGFVFDHVSARCVPKSGLEGDTSNNNNGVDKNDNKPTTDKNENKPTTDKNENKSTTDKNENKPPGNREIDEDRSSISDD